MGSTNPQNEVFFYIINVACGVFVALVIGVITFAYPKYKEKQDLEKRERLMKEMEADKRRADNEAQLKRKKMEDELELKRRKEFDAQELKRLTEEVRRQEREKHEQEKRRQQAEYEERKRKDEIQHEQEKWKFEAADKRDQLQYDLEKNRQTKILDFMTASLPKIDSVNMSDITLAATLLMSATEASAKKEALMIAASKVASPAAIDINRMVDQAVKQVCDQENGFSSGDESQAPFNSREP
ncbi:hypothetical protein Ocin01_13715 [Orchesella cincta]|uniref:Uncharacterized protein n=1 Tax=Orchesella cincta TaxID=48709 RepID=A0A1D2MJ16_ORCCI|nr:hypothetical protein Ocin01_13715 [Orchesella cincta]